MQEENRMSFMRLERSTCFEQVFGTLVLSPVPKQQRFFSDPNFQGVSAKRLWTK